MPHAQGKKMGRRHTTLIDAAESVVKAARQLDCVTRVTLGMIRQTKGNTVEQKLKITDIPAGLRVTVKGSKTVQELIVYTDDRTTAAKAMTRAFQA